MGRGSYMPWFPEPGSYIRYWDYVTRVVKFRRLVWQRAPLKYPRRLPVLAAGIKGEAITFEELNPSLRREHVYLAYLGVQPGFYYYLYHPVDLKILKWDEGIKDVDEDTVANLTYDESPYEFPTKSIGIERDRYPAVQALNISGGSLTPAITWIAALYKVVEHESLSDDELSNLQSGRLRSYPWDFGGEL